MTTDVSASWRSILMFYIFVDLIRRRVFQLRPSWKQTSAFRRSWQENTKSPPRLEEMSWLVLWRSITLKEMIRQVFCSDGDVFVLSLLRYLQLLLDNDSDLYKICKSTNEIKRARSLSSLIILLSHRMVVGSSPMFVVSRASPHTIRNDYPRSHGIHPEWHKWDIQLCQIIEIRKGSSNRKRQEYDENRPTRLE